NSLRRKLSGGYFYGLSLPSDSNRIKGDASCQLFQLGFVPDKRDDDNPLFGMDFKFCQGLQGTEVIHIDIPYVIHDSRRVMFDDFIQETALKKSWNFAE